MRERKERAVLTYPDDRKSERERERQMSTCAASTKRYYSYNPIHSVVYLLTYLFI